MTRNEFNSRFAASPDTTTGYDDAQLVEINNAVFDAVTDLDADARNAKSTVDHHFAKTFARY